MAKKSSRILISLIKDLLDLSIATAKLYCQLHLLGKMATWISPLFPQMEAKPTKNHTELQSPDSTILILSNINREIVEHWNHANTYREQEQDSLKHWIAFPFIAMTQTPNCSTLILDTEHEHGTPCWQLTALNLSWLILHCLLLFDMIKIVLLNSISPTRTCLNLPDIKSYLQRNNHCCVSCLQAQFSFKLFRN